MILHDDAIVDLFDRAVRPLRDDFVDDLVDGLTRSAGGAAPIKRLDISSSPHGRRAGRRWGAALTAVAACAVLVVGLVVAVRDRTPAPPDGAAAGTAAPSLPRELGDFVWPAPAQDLETVEDLVAAFVDEVLGWDTFDLEGDITGESQPQFVTLGNGELGVAVTGLAVPSPEGWGFVQVGSQMFAALHEPDGVMLDYSLGTDVAEVSVTLRLADGTVRTLEGGARQTVVPDVSIGDLVSVLVVGSDATGRVVAAVGGQFGSNEVTPPSVPAGTEVTVTGDGRLEEALQPNGRIVVVNAAGVAGLAGSLSDELRAFGLDVLEPENAPGGVLLDTSVVYVRPDGSFFSVIEYLLAALAVPNLEELSGQETPALSTDVIERADAIVVLGTDLATAPWLAEPLPPLDPGIGTLLILDATDAGESAGPASAIADDLRRAGVQIAAIAPATRTFDETMLMPIGGATPWTFAVATLAGVGGLDGWTPGLLDGELPNGVTAVLVVGNS